MSEQIFPLIAKVLLSGVLVLSAFVLLWQAWQIWFNRSLVLAPFDFLDAGKPSVESGEQFARMVRTDLVQLAGLYNAGEAANAAAVPSSKRGEPVVPMKIPAVFNTSFFESIELKAYGIDLGSLFKSLRRQIESPSEITGSVTHQGDQYLVFAELKQRGSTAPQRWSIQYAKDLPEATRGVASRLFRFLAVSSDGSKTEAALFRDVDDEDFYLFNRALAAYDQYRHRKPVLPDDAAAKLLAEADSPLANLLGRQEVTFPYVRKLAALVFYEQKKYPEAEAALQRYSDWLVATKREDDTATTLQTSIAFRKKELTPAVSKLRPLQAGSSVSLLGAKDAGMICCIAKDAAGRRYILSATQVFGSTAGEKIVQPAVRDGGVEADVVAVQDRATPTMSVARLNENIDTDPQIVLSGPIKGFESNPADGQIVLTYGFDGKRREGKVISTGASLKIEVDSDKFVPVDNAIITDAISAGGELGAPVITPEGNLVGMIFAEGGKTTTLVLPVEPVLKEFNLELIK